MISHAHPDHFMGVDVITEAFPHARIVRTQNVVDDIKSDGPWMFSMLQGKLSSEGPKQLVISEALNDPVLNIDRVRLEIVEFGEGESKHIAAVHIPVLKALLSADLVYMAKCPEYHVKQFLSVFSIPAYLPAASSS
jgi:glyoxylase-like metal-dependent hydrolase (beta-lactamase superfamily II)